MKALCVKSVVMDDGKTAFTKGEVYRLYDSTYRDDYVDYPCVRAKNDFKERHTVLSKELPSDEFFGKHFVLTI